MKILTMTSKKYHWLLPGFCYLMNEYWPGQNVLIGTDAPVEFDLPDNFSVHSYNSNFELPAEIWSSGFIYALERVPGNRVVLLFEDYWLIKKVNHEKIMQIDRYMEFYPNIMRFDLTSDRQFAGDAQDFGTFAGMKLVTTPFGSPYQMSLQAAMWNRTLLLKIIEEQRSPWEIEVHTQPPPSMKVLGTKSHPVKYVNIIHSGGNAEKELSFEGIPQKHMTILEENDWLEPR